MHESLNLGNSYIDKNIEETITRLVDDSDNPWLTGVCCINMDDGVEDRKIKTIFQTVENLREKYRKSNS